LINLIGVTGQGFRTGIRGINFALRVPETLNFITIKLTYRMANLVPGKIYPKPAFQILRKIGGVI
jgi:hypothetical protein